MRFLRPFSPPPFSPIYTNTFHSLDGAPSCAERRHALAQAAVAESSGMTSAPATALPGSRRGAAAAEAAAEAVARATTEEAAVDRAAEARRAGKPKVQTWQAAARAEALGGNGEGPGPVVAFLPRCADVGQRSVGLPSEVRGRWP